MRSASAPLSIDSSIGPALGAALIVAILTVFAVVGLVWVGLPIWLRLLLAVVCALVGTLSCYGLVKPRWRRIKLAGAELKLADAAGTGLSARMIGRPFVSPFYVGFRWRAVAGGAVRSLGLFRGQLSADAHRRMVTLLRYHQNT